MLSIGLVLLVLAVVAVLLVACLQKTISPSNEMTDGDTRAVRLLGITTQHNDADCRPAE